ncbi:MAG: prepilin-type N-terminal cleavage/methylation domain-containing protein [Gammaproteobacteria bacterium]|nr:MAG: prepilin-type N-terminal cleavage/methylation domain-containing protein [Gammaproteobacteria bacterium]
MRLWGQRIMRVRGCYKSSPGFHLLELLIVMAMIGLLAALSLPLYSQYVVQERRLEAAAMLSKLAIAMEEYHVDQNTYQNATLAALGFSEIIVDGYYQLSIPTETADDYLLMATPLGAQAAKDTACASLTLQANAKKGITGSGKVEECW